MPSAPVAIQGTIGEALAQAPRAGEQTEAGFRMTGRKEAFVASIFNDAKTLLLEGSYFMGSTPTPGTGITLSVATGTSFSDTQGLVGIDNIDTLPVASGGKRIYLDFIMYVVTTAPTAAVSHDIAHRTDLQNRFSGGTTVNAVNNNTGFANASIARMIANPTITAATANVRHHGHMTVRKAAAPAYIVGDIVLVKFGGVEMSNALGNFISTTQTIIVVPAPAICIAPGHSYVMNEWAASRTAALSGELFVGYVER